MRRFSYQLDLSNKAETKAPSLRAARKNSSRLARRDLETRCKSFPFDGILSRYIRKNEYDNFSTTLVFLFNGDSVQKEKTKFGEFIKKTKLSLSVCETEPDRNSLNLSSSLDYRLTLKNSREEFYPCLRLERFL